MTAYVTGRDGVTTFVTGDLTMCVTGDLVVAWRLDDLRDRRLGGSETT